MLAERCDRKNLIGVTDSVTLNIFCNLRSGIVDVLFEYIWLSDRCRMCDIKITNNLFYDVRINFQKTAERSGNWSATALCSDCEEG